MKQCANGHIYDDRAYSSCPYCGQMNAGVRPLGTPNAAFPKTEPINNSAPGFPATVPVNQPAQPARQPQRPRKEMSATVALNTNEDGVDITYGWLVVTSEKKKGMSFVIHGEKNLIGRGSNFDVDISFDDAVSKNGDAILTYDSRGKKFFITIGSGKNNVYHNGNLLLVPEEVKDYDTVEVGSTKLVFRSFCNEEFDY